MNEAVEKREAATSASELDLTQWSLVSFDAIEGSSLTYAQAVSLLDEKEAAGVYGLCILTDAAANRMR